MISSSCNGNDACERTYLHGNIAVGVGSISKLTIEIVSPSPNRAVIFQGKGMIISSCNGGDACERTYLHGNIAVGVGSISKLTKVIISPSPYCAIAANGKGMSPHAIF